LTLTPIGRARETGWTVFVAEAERIEQLPQLLSLPCPRFVLLLADAQGRSPDAILGELLDRGCVYLCAWGAACEQTHDNMDDVVLEREIKGAPEQTIMTTWHDKESLDEAVDFALRHARPDDALVPGCDAVVLAAIGSPEWARELHGIAQHSLLPPVL
jgi:hypothetical protein